MERASVVVCDLKELSDLLGLKNGLGMNGGLHREVCEARQTVPCMDSPSVTCAHALVRERDVRPGPVGFLAVASCPQWLWSQTA